MLPRLWRALTSWAAVPLAVVLVRAACLLVCPASVEAPHLLILLDLAALIPLVLAIGAGHMLGEAFGSVVLSLLIIGLPVAGLGWLSERVAGKATSALLGILCLLGIGVGFCLAAPARRDRFMRVFITILGVAALALGAKLLTEGHPRDAVIWIALPYALAAVVALIWRPLAQERSPAVESR